jgi:hypothetical protein
MVLTRRLLLAALALLLLAAAPAAAAPPQLGIGDQKTEMFKDPRFRDLDVRLSRVVVAWDAMDVRWQRREIDAWIAAARKANVRPLVIFSQSRRAHRHKILPTPKRFVSAFRRFRARYPDVTEFATWNEANLCGQPTCRVPGLVARYYKGLRGACPRCTILAASVLDMPNMERWVREFQRAGHTRPRFWGLNNYRDVNYRTTANTRALLRATRGQIWVTETGGIVKRRNRSNVRFEESADRAAGSTRFLFRRLVPLSSRITRLYLYHWNASTRHDTWDSALIAPNGRPRPALAIVRRQLAAWRPKVVSPLPPPPLAAPPAQPQPQPEPQPVPAPPAR